MFVEITLFFSYLTIKLWAREFYDVVVDEAEGKAESTITSKKSRANNLIVLVEF